MPCLKRNPALASPSGIDTGIWTSEVKSSLSIANHLFTEDAEYKIPENDYIPVSKEPELFSGLNVVDDDVAEVPRLHLPDPRVVVPDLNTSAKEFNWCWQVNRSTTRKHNAEHISCWCKQEYNVPVRTVFLIDRGMDNGHCLSLSLCPFFMEKRRGFYHLEIL